MIEDTAIMYLQPKSAYNIYIALLKKLITCKIETHCHGALILTCQLTLTLTLFLDSVTRARLVLS